MTTVLFVQALGSVFALSPVGRFLSRAKKQPSSARYLFYLRKKSKTLTYLGGSGDISGEKMPVSIIQSLFIELAYNSVFCSLGRSVLVEIRKVEL